MALPREDLEKQADYYAKNKSSIQAKREAHYKLNKSSVAQRLRFKKYFSKEDAMKYITSQQEHLYYHSLGMCQAETMNEFNHSVEYDNGLCKYCNKSEGIKLI